MTLDAARAVRKTLWVIKLNKPLPRGTIFKRGTRNTKNKFISYSGNFAKYTTETWFFKTKKEAEAYASDLYNWGSLINYVEICKVDCVLAVADIDVS